MYAPLVLKLVYGNHLFIRFLTHYFLRAPVAPIQVNATITPSPLSKPTSRTGAIAGGISSGVVALILLVGTAAFARRRWRLDDSRQAVALSFTGIATEARPQMTVTPSNPIVDGAAPLEVGYQIWTTSDGPSSSSEPPFPPTQSPAPAPVGLNSKELARLRSAPMLSPPTHGSSGSPPTYPPTFSATEGSPLTPTSNTQRLQTEMESLRVEMQQLQIRAERFEAPPSYGQGGGV